MATRTSLEILRGAKCPVLFGSKGSVLLLLLRQWSYRCLVCVDLRNQAKTTRFSGSFAAGGLWSLACAAATAVPCHALPSQPIVLMKCSGLVLCACEAHEWWWSFSETPQNPCELLECDFSLAVAKWWVCRGGSGITPQMVNTNQCTVWLHYDHTVLKCKLPSI